MNYVTFLHLTRVFKTQVFNHAYDLMKPHCFLQGFGKTKGIGVNGLQLPSLYISKNLFGNKIKVVTQY